jgi:hypothetical protein
LKAVLITSIVGLQTNTRRIATLPIGAVIELDADSKADELLVDVEWDGHYFSVFCQDLFDACTVADAVRLSFVRREWVGPPKG